jgi:hypothetical protein
MPRAPRRLFILASTLVLLVAAGTALGCGGDDDSAGEAPASPPTDTTDRPGMKSLACFQWMLMVTNPRPFPSSSRATCSSTRSMRLASVANASAQLSNSPR